MRGLMCVLVVMLVVGVATSGRTQPPAPAPQTSPSVVRIIQLSDVGGTHRIVTLAAGSQQGVTRSSKAHVLAGDTSELLPGGALVIIRIDARRTIVRSNLTIRQLEDNPRVQLSR